MELRRSPGSHEARDRVQGFGRRPHRRARTGGVRRCVQEIPCRVRRWARLKRGPRPLLFCQSANDGYLCAPFSVFRAMRSTSPGRRGQARQAGERSRDPGGPLRRRPRATRGSRDSSRGAVPSVGRARFPGSRHTRYCARPPRLAGPRCTSCAPDKEVFAKIRNRVTGIYHGWSPVPPWFRHVLPPLLFAYKQIGA